MILATLTDSKSWAKKRQENLDMARRCKEVLTDPNSYWRYTPDDERVKLAVNSWVERARKAHEFSLGRKPVIENFVYIGNGINYNGALYAR